MRRSDRGGLWIVDAVALGITIIGSAIRPSTWRRLVREQFLDTLERDGVGALRAVLIIAVLTGLVLVSQAIFWLKELGQPDSVRRILLALVLQQFAPIAVAVVLIGRSGLTWLGSAHKLWASGALRALERRGVDALVYLAVPMFAAFAVASACLTAVFVAASISSGFLAAELLGLSELGTRGALVGILKTLADSGPHWALAKALVLGGVVAVVVLTTAARSVGAGHERGEVLSRGFFRTLLGVLVVNGLISMVIAL
jgi:phospholipid/cholesterol/gamma-HCH transport system permease protein